MPQRPSLDEEETQMSKIVTCLVFARGEARKAAEFYAAIFPDSAIGRALLAASNGRTA
jgi:predicted 3-demethylubiquinone-9 3-methyltransferase (glyoxalase superfamily)